MHTNKNLANCSTNSAANFVNSQRKNPRQLLCTDKPLILSGSLAAVLKSADAAIVLQQVHYWLGKKGGKIIDGVHWIHNTYEQWLQQFPWLTKWRLRKVFYQLRDTGILLFAQHDQHEYKQRGYYTINYEKLKALQDSTADPPTHPCVRSAHIEMRTTHISLQENSLQKDLLTENTHPPHPAAVIEKNNKEREEVKQSSMMGETIENALEKENTQLETTKVSGGDHSSAARAEQNEKLDLIDSVGIRLNVQLVALVRDFTLENVKNAIAYYQQTKRHKERTGKTIERPAGWLTDCLRQSWWQQTAEPTQEETEFSNWYQNAIAQGIVEDIPISWLGKDRNNQYLVRQPIPGAFGAPYTLTPWRELHTLTTKPEQTKENTNNNDDFEEPD